VAHPDCQNERSCRDHVAGWSEEMFRMYTDDKQGQVPLWHTYVELRDEANDHSIQQGIQMIEEMGVMQRSLCLRSYSIPRESILFHSLETTELPWKLIDKGTQEPTVSMTIDQLMRLFVPSHFFSLRQCLQCLQTLHWIAVRVETRSRHASDSIRNREVHLVCRIHSPQLKSPVKPPTDSGTTDESESIVIDMALPC
jgi:hypothetical protein